MPNKNKKSVSFDEEIHDEMSLVKQLGSIEQVS